MGGSDHVRQLPHDAGDRSVSERAGGNGDYGAIYVPDQGYAAVVPGSLQDDEHQEDQIRLFASRAELLAEVRGHELLAPADHGVDPEDVSDGARKPGDAQAEAQVQGLGEDARGLADTGGDGTGLPGPDDACAVGADRCRASTGSSSG